MDTNKDSIVIDLTPENRTMIYQLLQARSMLKIEIKTKLVHSGGSVLKLVQQRYGIKARRKEKAVEEIEAKLISLGHVFATPTAVTAVAKQQ